MIKLGDRVSFVNENLEGTVTSIKGGIVGVTIENDFEIPVSLAEVVKIEEAGNKPEVKISTTTKPQFVKVHHGIHLAFQKIDDTRLDAFIHNSETDHALVLLYLNQTLALSKIFGLEETIKIGTYNLSEFNSWPTFNFSIGLFNNNYKPLKSFEKDLKFQSKSFHAAFKQCYFLGKQAYSFRLDEAELNTKIEQLKQHDFSAQAKEILPAQVSLNKDEIDLHADKLNISKQLSPSQIIDAQLLSLHEAIQSAIIQNKERIIIIHGVGNQYLKNKVLQYLKTHKQVIQAINNANELLYGGGATEVVFKR